MRIEVLIADLQILQGTRTPVYTEGVMTAWRRGGVFLAEVGGPRGLGCRAPPLTSSDAPFCM